MKIKKHGDGKVWVFSEKTRGWHDVAVDIGDLDPGEVLSELIKTKLKEEKDLSYGMAFSEVQKENPELSKRYFEQLRGRK
jgi:hypothetical protein